MLSENRTLARLVAMKTRDFDDPAFEDSCGREYLNSKRKIHKESSAIVHRSSEILVLRSKKKIKIKKLYRVMFLIVVAAS
jgi:hypothetical protein